MCTTCGCNELPHRHAGGVVHGSGRGARTVSVQADLLAVNNAHAAANRHRLAHGGVFTINLMSSPGAGKTTLIERTLRALGNRIPVAVIEGDQQTSRDADRIRAAGAAAVQINTGRACHLDAHLVGHALDELAPAAGSLLVIENVGNLICPSAFDLGETRRVVMLSVTEGEDKPLKYPHMFVAADALLLAKTDLLPHLDFDEGQCVAFARQVNPTLEVLRVSARSGEGMADWLAWLERGTSACRKAAREIGHAHTPHNARQATAP